MSQQGIDNARTLFLMAEIARGRGASAAPLARSMAGEVRRKWPDWRPLGVVSPLLIPPAPPAWSDILAARACLAAPSLREVGEAMARDLLTHAERLPATDYRAWLGAVLTPSAR